MLEKRNFNMESENDKVLDTAKELDYQKVVNLMKCIRCIAVCSDKVKMCQKVSKQFSELSGYKDADERAKVCKRLAKKTKEEIKKTIYEKAQNKKNAAKLAPDYKSAADEFRKVSGYSDADDLASQCDQLRIRIEKKAVRKRIVNHGVVALCIVAVIIVATASHTKYYYANACRATGSYHSAIKVYKKLGAYKDSKERLIECQYLNGLASEAEGDFKSAKKAFAAAGYYKDSEEQKVEMEKLIIKNSKVGDTVKLGDCDWIILDIQNNQVLLMKKAALPGGMAYNNDFEDVTWEKSTLRQWLNSEFLNETFSEIERNNIILTNVVNGDNAVYSTDGGNDTQDDTFLLSIEEVEKYNSLFPTFKSNSWLRSPGYSQRSAAFVSENGAVMGYGYATTSEEITVRPALWFRID